MLPPVEAIDAPVPPANATTALLTEIGTAGPLVAEGSVTVICPTTPSLIVVAFWPTAIHITDPLTGLQVSSFPAPVKAVPAATPIDATSLKA